MINEQLLQYIKKQREAGTADEEIKASLREAGWKDEDITEGFEAVAGDKNSPQSHQQMRKAARDDKQASSESGVGSQSSDTSTQSGQTQQGAAQKQAGDASTQDKQQQAKQESQQQESKAQQQQAQKQPENKKGNQNQQGDTYREAVSEEDKQGVGAAGPSEAAANTDPTPLRTMEDDRQRVQGEGKQQPQQSQTGEKSAQTKQQDTSAASQSDNKQAGPTTQKQTSQDDKSVESQLAKQQRKKKRKAKQKQQSKKQAQTKTGSNQGKRGSVSRMGPKSRSGSQKKQRQAQGKSRIQQARRQSSSSSSIATIILSILGLLLVGGGAAYAYVTYFQGPSASTNAQAVMESLADAESFQYRIGINKQEGSGDGVIIEGAVDMNPDTEAQTYYTIQSSGSQAGTPVTGLASEFSQYPDLDPRQQQTIQQALDNQQFLQVGEFQTTQMLGVTENSSGFTTHRFGVSLNPSRLFSTYSTIHQEIYDESIDSELASTLQNNLGNFTPEQGQLWVHPTSSVPYQLTVIGSNANGESVQVNVQLKNHGQEITALTDTYDTRSIAAGLSEYFSGDSSADESDIATTTQPDPGDGDDESDDGSDQSTTTSSATTSEPTDTQQQREAMRRQDQMRINDVQQIVVALRIYANNNNELPNSLAELAGGDVLSSVPRDPQTGQPYQYVHTSSGRYHVGATLRATSEGQLAGDDNYNSIGSASNGFAGAASVCGNAEGQAGSTCYDKTGQLSN